MSTEYRGYREYTSGFANLVGDTFGTCRVDQLSGRKPVKWSLTCLSCGTKQVEWHTRLMQDQQNYKCKNTACALGRIERPKLKSQPTEPVSVPAPAQKVSQELAEYTLYIQQMKEWGLGKDLATFEEFRSLSPEYRARITAPVIAAQKAAIQKRELEALADGIEASERERMRRSYGV